MDILRADDFLKNQASSSVTKKIKEAGWQAEFNLEHFDITRMGDGSYNLHINGDLNVKKEDITRLIQSLLWNKEK